MYSPKLLSSMSQEIRTQMNSIVGLSFLLEKSCENKSNNNYSDQVYRSCNQLIGLFEDFFETAINERTRSRSRAYLQRSTLNISAEKIFAELREYLEQNYKGTIILITDNEYTNDPEIKIDEKKVSRVLHYLFQNAVNNTNLRYIKVGYKYDDGKVTFFVLDSHQDYALFKKYFQIEGSNSQMSEYYDHRTSLNIILAKKNVKLLGGKIWIEPYDITGTGFYFSIRVKR